MQYVCDAPDGKTWFRLESEEEAEQESALMDHAVAKHYRRAQEKAAQSYRPLSSVSFERDIGLKAHLQREMPLFLTLRNGEGEGLVTAMLPPGAHDSAVFRTIVVGRSNRDPYDDHDDAIRALGRHFAIELDRRTCYPYRG
jgi:hypothetical protein